MTMAGLPRIMLIKFTIRPTKEQSLPFQSRLCIAQSIQIASIFYKIFHHQTFDLSQEKPINKFSLKFCLFLLNIIIKYVIK